jgi:hypothetical protein
MARQRRSNWIPVIVSSNCDTEHETKISQADDFIGKLAFSEFHVTDVDDVLSEGTPKGLDPKTQRRADLRFAIGVAIALALPAFIGFGLYVAAGSIIRTMS